MWTDAHPDLALEIGSIPDGRTPSAAAPWNYNEESEESMNTIVCGVDRSDGAKAALAFAHDEAQLRGATLRAVHAWQYSYVGSTGFDGVVPTVGGDIGELPAAAAAVLDAIVREVIPDPGEVDIEQRVVPGTAGAVLVEESRQARSARGGLARPRRLRAAPARLGQPAVRAPRGVPSRDPAIEVDRKLMDVRLKRIYDPAAASDGERILIDRLWPRGFTHEHARIDEWARDLAPSVELRRWFGHDPARFEEFRRRYVAELAVRRRGSQPSGTARGRDDSRSSTPRATPITTTRSSWPRSCCEKPREPHRPFSP